MYDSVEDQNVLIEDIPYEPVRLRFGLSDYIFHGARDGLHYSGTIEATDGSKQVWKLRRVSPEELSSQVASISAIPFDTSKWLDLRRQLREIRAKLVHADELIIEQHASYEKLLVCFLTFLNLLNLRSGQSHFTLFLIDGKGTFAATPIRAWDINTIRYNSKSSAQLKKMLEAEEATLQEKREHLELRELELDKLRKQASKIAGVEGIVELKMELAILQGGVERSAEKDRLQELVALGRASSDSPNAKIWRKTPAGHLKKAAKAKAMADRLNTGRKNAALASLKTKLRAIKETRNYNPKDLAREFLRLRKKRLELESRLNLRGKGKSSGAEQQNDF